MKHKKSKHPERTKIRLPKLSKVRAEVWKLMAQYVKARDNYTCVTCGKILGMDNPNLHASHYVHGDSYDFNPIVINSQCRECHFLFGQSQSKQSSMLIKELYRQYMFKKWGEPVVRGLICERYRIHKHTREELSNIAEDLKNRMCQLLAERV